VSIRLMAATFELDIRAADKLVLLAMADHARDDGTGCYPSVETLARKTSQSRRGVQKIMRRLEHAGLIAPSKLSKGRRSSEYRIALTNREPGSLFPHAQPRTPAQSTANLSASNREPECANGRRILMEPSRTVLEPSGAPARTVPSPSSFAGTHLSVSQRQDQLLASAFPWVNRQTEYRKIDSWLEANPNRRPRKQGRFVHNWFAKIDLPGGRNGSSGSNRKASGATAPAAGKYSSLRPALVASS
jgi:hypothetical protein